MCVPKISWEALMDMYLGIYVPTEVHVWGYQAIFRVSQNYSFGLERTFKHHLVPNSVISRDTVH